MPRLLVTGGAGYIGSHTCIELLEWGFELIILDNLANSSLESLRRVASISGMELEVQVKPQKSNNKFIFIKGDIDDQELLRIIFKELNISGVIHFAGLKSVSESISLPLQYYKNNVYGTISLLNVMSEFGCKNLVFSSSATVYGDSNESPISENSKLSTTNPYGASKLVVENILKDLSFSDNTWSIAILRYFNPVGAHQSGLIGEDPSGIPNNLMPIISQVAVGKREKLLVFGGDYKTADGTGVRDFIHVCDLAKGHLKAFLYLEKQKGNIVVNLGTGKGQTVLSVIKAFENVSQRKIPFEIVERRPGDVAICYADASYSYRILGWKAELNLERMCEDTWRWQFNNPKGFRI